ncbi:uncharacterized protein LOC124479600 [Hypomesus transpacificus]|uniref:uncharacterized protein LOC124479600 n=1 Tax=Hypomesus transpacificus TaxID=137520 RepID=UPI001F0853B6|nr:uncharacterized protein LOC124479600 [Hypomesus transpacificus]XP_046894366.1 uncharacterized protein LOC124479600 [Hypomesus transpacificus]XP_046894367.1 uncharacterized protein LOC124479600 [Hypomesus transpacificus]
MEKNNTDSSQPEVNEGREGSLSGNKGTFIRVLTVRPLSLEDMDLVEPSDLPPPTVPTTGSKDQLEALEVASTSQGVSGVERMPPGTASRHIGTPSPDMQVEAKASLGSVAAEVIEAVISNVLAARAALQEEAQGPVTCSSVSYFLSAVCADVQTLPLLRRSGSSSRSCGRSLGELLTTMSRTNVVQAVELKLEEQFGPCRKEGSSTSSSSQSLTEDLIMLPYLGNGRYGHSMASDLVDGIIESMKSAVELLENQSSTSRAGNSSSLTGWDALDVSSAAKKMVCKAAAKLSPLVSSSRMGDVTADESVSLMNETSLESLPPSLIRLLLIRSVDTVSAACRAISSEFCFRESVKNEGLTKLQELANEQMLACLNKGVEEVEIDELIEGISAISDHSLILRRPELSFSHIYRSLFVDTLLPGCGHRTTEVLETLIFLCPQGPPTAGENLAHNNMRVGEIIKEYVIKGRDVFQQVLRRATQKFSRQPATTRDSPHAANPESSGRPSLLVSSDNCENLLGVILDDLHEVVEQHKASAKTRSGGRKFWEQVHSSSQLLYDSTLRTLQKAAHKLAAFEERTFEIIPPMPSRQEPIHSCAESSVQGQLQKSLEVNLPSTSSLACQETQDRTVRILTERVMDDTLCESAAAAPCPGADLSELSPAAVIIDAGTASTSAGETRKPKKGLEKWWSKKAKLFKNKVLKRKTEPKKPSALEELPPSSHVTPGAKCGSPPNLEQSKDHKTNQEPLRHPLHVRMFRALQSIVKTFKVS